MSSAARTSLGAVGLVLLAWLLSFSSGPALAQEIPPGAAADPLLIVGGTVFDTQNAPVENALVTLLDGTTGASLAKDSTPRNGRYALSFAGPVPADLLIQIDRPHFQPTQVQLSPENIRTLRGGQPVEIPEIILARKITAAFWIATFVFIAILALIATGTLHNTLAALLGMSIVLGVSYLLTPISEGFFIFYFPRALSYVDWNVIFLVMGMMIVIAVVERTGIFQWMAFMAYRVLRRTNLAAGGHPDAHHRGGLGFSGQRHHHAADDPDQRPDCAGTGHQPADPADAEVLASNVVGISTLIGTPTNILIGSYANITFTDFLINLTPACCWPWWPDRSTACSSIGKSSRVNWRAASPHARWKGWPNGRRSPSRTICARPAVVGGAMLLLFIFGEQIHLHARRHGRHGRDGAADVD